MNSAEGADAAIALTRELVRIDSVSGREAGVAAAIARYLGGHGIEADIVDVDGDRRNVLAFVGRRDAVNLLLSGHTDTVPLGPGWTRDPLGGELVDGRIYGRGSCDMKAGLAAMLVGLVTAAKSMPKDALGICFAGVIDEEVSGKGTRHIAASGLRANAAVIAEPTELEVVRAAKGNGYINVAISGKAAHAGSPAMGENAIALAARVVAAVERFDTGLDRPVHPLLGKRYATVTRITGGEGDSIVPSGCSVLLDIRTLPGVATTDMLRDLDAEFDRAFDATERRRIRAEVVMDMPAMETPETHALCGALRRAVSAAGGPDRPVGGWSAACDGGLLQVLADIPTMLFGPGSIVREAHRPDESVPVDEILVATDAFRRLVESAFTEPLVGTAMGVRKE